MTDHEIEIRIEDFKEQARAYVHSLFQKTIHYQVHKYYTETGIIPNSEQINVLREEYVERELPKLLNFLQVQLEAKAREAKARRANASQEVVDQKILKAKQKERVYNIPQMSSMKGLLEARLEKSVLVDKPWNEYPIHMDIHSSSWLDVDDDLITFDMAWMPWNRRK